MKSSISVVGSFGSGGRHFVPMVGIIDADGRRVAPGLGQLEGLKW